MNILAIDTTTRNACVCLKYKDEVIEKNIENNITHSEKLLPLIDDVLTKKNITLDDIDMFFAINGPGSFTGIRIGLATIKAFAQVKEKKIFCVPSTDLMAYSMYKSLNTDNPQYIVHIKNEKNDRAYYGIYEIKTLNKKIIIKKIKEINNDYIDLAKEDIENFAKENKISNLKYITDTSDFDTYIKDRLLLYPKPSMLITLYEDLLNKDKYIFDAYTLNGYYARKSQAERLKNELK